ncbi:putative uncharacterized protein [Moritella viscosa]|nr:hypothetical protein [Moritella viscosa]CED60697.1 putative uncharacterized protein [Moritella viscosa]
MKKYHIIFIMCFSNPTFSNVEMTEKEKKYESLVLLNAVNMTEEETDNTSGSAGPLITGVIGGVGSGAASVAGDISADKPIDWTSAGINAVSGFVAGASGVGIAAGGSKAVKIASGLGGAALGISAQGMMTSIRRSGGGGGSSAGGSGGGSCDNCHGSN